MKSINDYNFIKRVIKGKVNRGIVKIRYEMENLSFDDKINFAIETLIKDYLSR